MNELSKEVLIARCEAAIKQLEPCAGTAERQSLECFRIALQSLLALRERAEPVAGENLPCPFCGGACDPAGWLSEQTSGPECENCGATAENIEAWNRRTAAPALVVPEAIENAIEYIKSIAFHIDENDYHGQHIAHFMQQAIMWLEGDDCRAAMLAPVVPAPAFNSACGFEDFWSNFEHPFAEDDELKSFASEIYRAAMQGKAEHVSQQASNEHVRREYRMEGSIWVQCSKQEYDRKKAAGREVRELYERPQNAQQNIPENIPDGWIKCSERMPKERQEVIVMDVERNKVQSGIIYTGGCFVDFNEEYYEVENPSHWQPLPAAPGKEG